MLRSPRGLVTIGLAASDSPVIAFVTRWISPAYLLVEGIIIVVLILFAPEGIAGLLQRLRARRRGQEAAPPAPTPVA